MEFAGPAPLGPFAALAAEMPLRKPGDVKKIEPGSRAQNTAPDTGRDRDNGTEAAAARDIDALRREMARRNLPAGPPPSFQVSLLEVETDIRQVIARIEAARAQARETDAVRSGAVAEDAGAEAGPAAAAGSATAAPGAAIREPDAVDPDPGAGPGPQATVAPEIAP